MIFLNNSWRRSIFFQASVELRHKLESQLKLNVNRSARCPMGLICITQVLDSIMKISRNCYENEFDNEVGNMFHECII